MSVARVCKQVVAHEESNSVAAAAAVVAEETDDQGNGRDLLSEMVIVRSFAGGIIVVVF